jgi:DNA-binding XRE family transcriptional regulator
MKAWRELFNLSQAMVADEFNCTRQKIISLEKRGNDPLPVEWQYAITLLQHFPEMMSQEFGTEHLSKRSPRSA